VNQETDHGPTLCYTYEVTMVVQVLAKNKEEADSKLQEQGGYVSKRDVSFKDVVSLYSGIESVDLKEE